MKKLVVSAAVLLDITTAVCPVCLIFKNADDNKPKVIAGFVLCAAVVGLALLITVICIRRHREIRRTTIGLFFSNY